MYYQDPERKNNNGGCLKNLFLIAIISRLFRPRYRGEHKGTKAGNGCFAFFLLGVGLYLIFNSSGRTVWTVIAGILLALGGIGGLSDTSES